MGNAGRVVKFEKSGLVSSVCACVAPEVFLRDVQTTVTLVCIAYLCIVESSTISILNTRSVYKPGGLSGVGHTKAVAAGQLGVAGQLWVQRVVSCWSARSCW